MTLDEQLYVFRSFTSDMEAILVNKGDDYSDEDRLSVFKNVASMVGITPAQVALTLVCIKTARLGNLLKTLREPNNEAITDSVLDMANYTAMLNMVLIEEQKQVPGFSPVG